MRLILAILLMLCWANIGTAQVTVGAVSVQPSVLNINPDGASTVRVRWRVQLISSVGGTAMVQSPAGLLQSGSTLGGTLARTVRHPGGGTYVVTLTESLYVDRTTAQQIAAAGPNSYTRRFSVAGSGGAMQASVRLQPSSGGALSLRNLDLSFDDGTRYRVLEPGDALGARLTVSTNGRGYFAGRWEFSGPNSGAFRPLGRVQKRLAGARRTVFELPKLPTDGPGLYRVRFVPDQVQGQQRLPELSYSVVGARVAPKAPALSLLSPPVAADVTRATRFAWSDVAGAARYKVEFSTAGQGGFSGDVLAAVATSDTTMRLKPTTLRRLTGQSALFWRVIAFDRTGHPIASSAKRRLR